jgi:hypothetical protein
MLTKIWKSVILGILISMVDENYEIEETEFAEQMMTLVNRELKTQSIEPTEDQQANIHKLLRMISGKDYRSVVTRLFASLAESIQKGHSENKMLDIVIFFQSHGVRL